MLQLVLAQAINIKQCCNDGNAVLQHRSQNAPLTAVYTVL